MSPQPHQSTPHLSIPTATPAVRPFSMHTEKKIVTDSAQRKLDRKRANARLRQQRCRARKRAKMQAEESGSIPTSETKPVGEKTKENVDQSAKPAAKVGIKPLQHSVTGMRSLPMTRNHQYWQPAPPPTHVHPGMAINQKPANIAKPSNQGISQPSSSVGWKHATQPSMYSAMQANYYYSQHHQAYSMPWYAWSQAAYYGQTMPAHHHQQQSRPSISNVPSGDRPQLPPASPLKPVSPVHKSPVRHETSSVNATTPYHQVEEMVKSPMFSSTNVTATPLTKNSLLRISESSPESDILPPLWSAVTKPTPVHALQSPWSKSSIPSPPFLDGDLTPAPRSKWNWSGFHQTPSLPLTTPIKPSSEMSGWHSNASPA